MKLGKYLAALAIFGGSSSLLALVPAPQVGTSNLRPVDNAQPGNTAANRSWIVSDPMTGRTYQQQLVSVQVPTTKWETKPVAQTVYEPTLVTKVIPTQQTVFVPQTNHVLQQRVRGRLNPFRQPYYTYRYRPVTTWTPVTQTVNTAVTTQQWIAKQQTVYVQQPVQKMETQQQLVQTEIPSPSGTMLATRPPLITVPLLARQRVLPWPAVASRNVVPATTGTRPIASGTLASVRGATYSAPLKTAANNGLYARDSVQSGMSATVLR